MTDDLWLLPPPPPRVRYRRYEVPPEAAGVGVVAAPEGGDVRGRLCALLPPLPLLRLRCCSGTMNSSSPDAVGGRTVTCTLLGDCRESNPVWCVMKFCRQGESSLVLGHFRFTFPNFEESSTH